MSLELNINKQKQLWKTAKTGFSTIESIYKALVHNRG